MRPWGAAAILAAWLGGAGSALSADCHLDVTPMTFGGYAGAEGAVGTASLKVICFSLTGGDVSFTINGTDPAPGALVGAKGRLAYRLYLDPAYSQPWTLSQPLAGHLTLTPRQSRSVVFTLYGRAPAHQRVTAGDYAETLLLQLSYH
jgi:spore coat protein U-like protein